MAVIALDNPKGSKPIILSLHLAVGLNCLLPRDNKFIKYSGNIFR